jgi:hypothetical protein
VSAHMQTLSTRLLGCIEACARFTDEAHLLTPLVKSTAVQLLSDPMQPASQQRQRASKHGLLHVLAAGEPSGHHPPLTLPCERCPVVQKPLEAGHHHAADGERRLLSQRADVG